MYIHVMLIMVIVINTDAVERNIGRQGNGILMPFNKKEYKLRIHVINKG